MQELGIFIVWLHFYFNLDDALAVILTIADPDVAEALPVISAFVNREPRPCHKVHAFESQPDPIVVQPHAFDRSACNEWLDIIGLHLKHVPTVKRDACRFIPGPHDAPIIRDPN